MLNNILFLPIPTIISALDYFLDILFLSLFGRFYSGGTDVFYSEQRHKKILNIIFTIFSSFFAFGHYY